MALHTCNLRCRRATDPEPYKESRQWVDYSIKQLTQTNTSHFNFKIPWNVKLPVAIPDIDSQRGQFTNPYV